MEKQRQPSIFHFDDMTHAWHGFHDYMFNHEDKLRKLGGTIYGSELVSYDNIFYIKKAVLDPEFNFGKILGYKNKKWAKLLNNYLNFNYLDLVKHEIIERELKRGNSYNFTYRFDNSHGSGKDCLISLNFCRRKGEKVPTVIFTSRASEWTKRVAFDFLLIQRMVEYVYGEGKEVQLVCFLPFIFVNLECSLMYVAEFGKKVIKKDPEKGYSPFQERMVKKLKEYQTIDTEKIKYKVHQRAAKQVQRDKDGRPIAGIPDLFAKELDLYSSSRLKRNDPNNIRISSSGSGRAGSQASSRLETQRVFKELKKQIMDNKGKEQVLQNALMAIGSRNPFFWPKGWDQDLFKVITKPSHSKYTKRIIKLLAKNS